MERKIRIQKEGEIRSDEIRTMMQKHMVDDDKQQKLIEFIALRKKQASSNLTVKTLEIYRLKKENLINKIALHVNQNLTNEPHLVTLFLDTLYDLTHEQIKELAEIEFKEGK